jgi:RNA polymerase sigma-70 factor (ECF subfamily)
VRGLLRQLTRTDVALADDLAQEAFIRAYKNIRSFRGEAKFSTWLYRIATNLAIDEMRYRKRRGQVFYNNVWDSSRGGESDRPEMQISDVRRGPREEVLRKESSQVLGDAIRSLPEKYRVAFIMKEVQELPYETIAQVLKCSTGTIKSRLHRARELLQRKLEHYM